MSEEEQPANHTLKFLLLSASNLTPEQWSKTCAPFCTVRLNGELVYSSLVKEDTVSPTWRETVLLKINDQTLQFRETVIAVEVHDFNLGSATSLMGQAEIKGVRLLHFFSSETPSTYPLKNVSGDRNTQGVITISFVSLLTSRPKKLTKIRKQTLRFQLTGARQLRKETHRGTVDPYCIVRINGEERAQTRVIEDSTNPNWEEEVEVHFHDPSDQFENTLLTIEVYNFDELCLGGIRGVHNPTGGHAFLGQVQMHGTALRGFCENSEPSRHMLFPQDRSINSIVQTKMGLGTVIEDREEDETQVVELEWNLACGKKATLYQKVHEEGRLHLQFLSLKETVIPPKHMALSIRVVQAANLGIANESTGFARPYCKVTFAGETIGNTSVVSNSLNPQWYHNFNIEILPNMAELPTKSLAFEIYDERGSEENFFLGRTNIAGLDFMHFLLNRRPVQLHLTRNEDVSQRASGNIEVLCLRFCGNDGRDILNNTVLYHATREAFGCPGLLDSPSKLPPQKRTHILTNKPVTSNSRVDSRSPFPPRTTRRVVNTPSPRKTKMKLTVKKIFETPKKLLIDMTPEEYEQTRKHTNSIINDLKAETPITDVLSIAHRLDVPTSTAYREKLGSVMFKVKPVKHLRHKQKTKFNPGTVEDIMFHDVNTPRKEDGYTPLCLAAKRGNIAEMKLLYHYGADLNLRVNGMYSWDHGKSPLYIAAEQGLIHAVYALLKLGAKVDLPDHNGMTPLHAAAKAGNIEVVSVLKHSGGADVNHEAKNGETAMISAAFEGRTRMITELYENGAEVNQCRYDGWTPLHAAAAGGHGAVIARLVEYGANINIATKGHRTALALAERYSSKDHEKAAHILRAHGGQKVPIYKQVREACREGDDKKLANLLRRFNCDVNFALHDGITPLWVASMSGNATCVRLLIEHGADVHMPTIYGDTPMDIALQEGHLHIARYLREIGGHGWTAVHIAVEDDDIPLLEKLACEGKDLNKPDDDGWSPAHVAADSGHIDVLRALSRLGADLNQRSTNKQTPMMLASYKAIVAADEAKKDIFKKIKLFLEKWTAFQSPEMMNSRIWHRAAYVIQRKFRVFMRCKQVIERMRTGRKASVLYDKPKRKARHDDIVFHSPVLKQQAEQLMDPINEIPMSSLEMFEPKKSEPTNFVERAKKHHLEQVRARVKHDQEERKAMQASSIHAMR